MDILLDTHSFLWFIMGDSRLSTNARQLIENEENQLFLSLASVWEMSIKISLRKLELSEPLAQLLPSQLQINGINLLEIKFEHLIGVSTLPFHHRDPFDRLLISQSLVEEIPILSEDKKFDEYGVERLR